MTVDTTNYGVAFRAPALPYAPVEYDQQHFEQLSNVMRLYFSQLDTAIRNATVSDRAEAVAWFIS
tara:strand:+ start:4659 stop:4853 length:195 start_codon:yes stop_codon:yes gene_type:complete